MFTPTGNLASYSAFVLHGSGFYLVISGGERWVDGVKRMAMKIRTDGGQGKMKSCVCLSTCLSIGKDTHTSTCVCESYMDERTGLPVHESTCENSINLQPAEGSWTWSVWSND